MDPQQLLATLIQLSDEQQHRIAELLNRLEQQTQTLTTRQPAGRPGGERPRPQRAENRPHLQAAVRESVETALHDTLTTLSQRAERAFQEAGRPLLHTLAGVTKAAEETEERLQRAVKTFRWQMGRHRRWRGAGRRGGRHPWGVADRFARWCRGGARNWSSSTRRSPRARRGSKN
jgi:hypothetical protein